MVAAVTWARGCPARATARAFQESGVGLACRRPRGSACFASFGIPLLLARSMERRITALHGRVGLC